MINEAGAGQAGIRGSIRLSDGMDEAVGDLAVRLILLQGRLDERIERLPLAITFPIPEIDLLNWLRRQAGRRRQFWSSRRGNLELAGSGAALELMAGSGLEMAAAYDEIQEILARVEWESLYFMGGQVFDGSEPPVGPWSRFPLLGFTVPEILLSRREGRFTATLSVAVGRDSTLAQVRSSLTNLGHRLDQENGEADETAAVSILSRVDLPDYDGWRTALERTLSEIEQGKLDKVVLARRSDLHLDRKVDPVLLLETITRLNPKCFGFMYEPVPGLSFLGASPERLFSLELGRLTTEAMAGSAVPIQADAQDTWAGDPTATGRDGSTCSEELLACEKNGREHEHVLKFLSTRMKMLCSTAPTPAERGLVHLSNVSHICVELTGELIPGLSLDDVISKLHPTPAVCGISAAAAMGAIRELEQFERGWYSGAIGVIGRDLSEFTVAIRSALVAGDRVTAFAGAGIVKGSHPRSEWLELEAKIDPVIASFGGA